MIQVHLPDGSARELEKGSSAADLASQIGPGLARAAVAAVVDEQVSDLSQPLTDGARVRLLTKRDPEALGIMRHSCAHVMAQAVMRLYQGVQLAFGPTTATGFYYDFELSEPISEDDFPKIETEMRKIVKENAP